RVEYCPPRAAIEDVLLLLLPHPLTQHALDDFDCVGKVVGVDDARLVQRLRRLADWGFGGHASPRSIICSRRSSNRASFSSIRRHAKKATNARKHISPKSAHHITTPPALLR